MNREKIIEFLRKKAQDLDPFKDTNIQLREPNHIIPEIVNNRDWILYLYHNILKMSHVDENDQGYQHWMKKISEGMPRKQIEDFFRNVAVEENKKIQNSQVKFEDFLNSNDKGRVLYVMPESNGDILLSTALFKSIKERYPEYSLYVSTKPEYRDILMGNPYMDKWLEYSPMMENLIALEGNSETNGYFDIVYLPHLQTQRPMNFHIHNTRDKIDFNLNMTNKKEEQIALS